SVTTCNRANINGPFAGATELEEVIFEEGITAIPSYALASENYSSNVATVVIPDSVETIGSYAFYNCDSITEVTFPAKLKTLSDYAFYDCGSLESVTFTYNPEMVKTTDNGSSSQTELYRCAVGYRVFCSCGSLKCVTLSENVRSLGDQAFDGCQSLSSLELPCQLEELGYYAFRGTGIQSITIPKSVTTCNRANINGPFAGATELEAVIFEEGITAIPSYTLASENYSSYVEKVIIPASVTSIGDYAFYNCNAVTIYGVPGSYAETYAELNQIPFVSINEYDPNLYKNVEYIVKIVDSSTSLPLKGAVIEVAGEKDYSFTTDENGLAKVAIYGMVAQRIKVSKSGYKAVSYTENPWSTGTQNVVQLKPNVTVEQKVELMLPNTKLSSSTLKGPQITVFNETFNLFETEISFDVPFFDSLTIKTNEKDKTIKVLLGLSDSYKAKIQASGEDDTYWSESYQEVKSLVKACGGKVDTPRLWNQFSSLRGKLKSVDGTASIGVSGKATGFIEISYATGEWVITDSGMVANLSASASAKIPLCYVFYSEFGLSGSVDGTIQLKADSARVYTLSGSLGVSLTPSVALGANVAIVDVKGGLQGTLSGKLSFPAETMQEAFTASLNGKLFLKTQSVVSIFNYSNTWDIGTVELYPDFGAYLEPAEWKLAMEDRVVPADGEAYEYAYPQTALLSDGRKVMVYITDDGTKTTGNHTTLMYKVYENGAWSGPEAVCETGRADVTPVLCAAGSKAYVAWLNISEVIDSETEAEYVYEHTDLWVSEFDGTSFGTPELVPDAGNSKIEFQYDIQAEGDDCVIAWVENGANDPFMQSGTNTIYYRVRKSGQWQAKTKLLSTRDTVSGLEAACQSGNITVSYSNGTSVYSVSASGAVELGKGTNAKVFDGVTYFIKDGQLYSVSGGTETAYGIACSSDYQVLDGTVYWTEQSNFTSELYMQELDGETATRLTYDNAFVSSFSLVKDGSGISIDYVSTAVNESSTASPYGRSVMKTLDTTEVYDLECGGILYDEMEVQPGKSVEFSVLVVNHSSRAVDSVVLKVRGKNNVIIYNDTVLDRIGAGETKEVAFTYQLPDSLSGLKLTAEVYSNTVEEADEDNNVAYCTFGSTDLQITEADRNQVTVVNAGYNSAQNAVLTVREGSADGAVLDTVELGTLNPGKTVAAEIRIPDSSLLFESAQDVKIFYMEVSSDTEETLAGDNSFTLTVEPGHVEGVSLDYESLTMEKGQSRTLKATVTGDNAADTGVLWSSSDTDVVSVSENGTVEAVSEGTAAVTVITVDGGYAATCEITVEGSLELESLSFKETSVTLVEGETRSLELVYEPSDAEVDVTRGIWSSSDPDVATVADGVVTAAGAGSAEITVQMGGLTAACLITVESENPVILSVEAPAYNKLKITWAPVAGADGYVVYRSTAKDGEYSLCKSISGNETFEYVNSVTSGVTYYYKLKSYHLDESGNKVFSEFSEAVSGKALPAAPTIQSTVMTAYNKICISWTKVNGCEGYVIYRSTSENGTYSVMKTVTQATATSYTNMVTSSEDYYYKIRAYVLVDEKKVYGEYSNISMGNVITGPPAEFDGTVVSATKLKFTWSKVEDADGYVIYMSSSEDAGYKAVKNITSKDTLTYSKTLSSTAPYYYKMRAYRLIDGKKVYSDYTETIKR
ncbi:MAG: leucine-rich repeat protein, partial [Lachnospiraceae bacterium]